MNQVILIGKLGKDPEMKYFESGAVKTTISLAVGNWDNKQKKEITDWYNVEFWNNLAEFAGENLKKGKMAIIEGAYKEEVYEKDGEQKISRKVIANNVCFNSAAFMMISGNVENIENRVNQQDKKIQNFNIENLKFNYFVKKDAELGESETIALLAKIKQNDGIPNGDVIALF